MNSQLFVNKKEFPLDKMRNEQPFERKTQNYRSHNDE